MRFGSVALAQFFDVSFSGETAFTMTHGTGFTVVGDQRKSNLPPAWIGRTCVITFVVSPLGLITLAALLPHSWSLRLVNRHTKT